MPDDRLINRIASRVISEDDDDDTKMTTQGGDPSMLKKLRDAISTLGDEENAEPGEEEEETKETPGKFPNLESPDEPGDDGHDQLDSGLPHNDNLDSASAIGVVGALKQALADVGCILKDFRVKFHLNGFDIDEIKVSANDLDGLRSKLTPEEIKSMPSDDPTSLALQVIKQEFNQVMTDKYGYDSGMFAYDNSDAGGISISKLPEEQPGIDDIAGNMEPLDMGAGDLGPEMESPMGAEPAPDGLDLAEPQPLDAGAEAGALPAPAPAAPAPAAPALAPLPPM